MRAVTIRDNELSVAEHPDPTPGAGEVPMRGALSKDGTLYVACLSGLYKRAKDRWEAVDLPGDAKPQDVAPVQRCRFGQIFDGPIAR